MLDRFLFTGISFGQVPRARVKLAQSKLDQGIPDMEIRGTLMSLSSVSGFSLAWHWIE